MTAGLNVSGNILRFSATSNDDVVGGAVPSGTVIYSPVFARIKAEEPTLALLEQGLETPEIFTSLMAPGTIVLQHNDQYEVTSPPASPHYGKRFVIIGVQPSDLTDRRKYIRVTMRRIEQAHLNTLQ